MKQDSSLQEMPNSPLLPTLDFNTNMMMQFIDIYSQVANRRGGRLLIFRNFSDPSDLIRIPLTDFQEKGSDQDVFTPDLLYFQFFLSENAFLTPI